LSVGTDFSRFCVIVDWHKDERAMVRDRFADFVQAIFEELRPLYESADAVRRLVSHPWLIEQANATAAWNSAITCSKWYYSPV